MDFRKKLMVRPGAKVRLSRIRADETLGFSKGAETKKLTEKAVERLDALQSLLYAENKHALLILLQGMDAAGKDGTIRHVMSGVNPQGCRVTSFKVPTPDEAEHDFLWRAHMAVPERGQIGIFNRSYYEDVLIVRVHKFAPEKVWKRRFEQINGFEELLAQNHVTILKFFLYVSADEQKKRLEARLKDPRHQWKFSPSDFAERQFWDDYMDAYEDALTKCGTEMAPWFVVPSDHRWFRNLAISSIIAQTLGDFDMHYPRPKIDLSQYKIK